MKGKLSKLRNEKKTNKLIQASISLNKESKNKLNNNDNPTLTLKNEKNSKKSNNQIKDNNTSNIQNLYAEDSDYEIESISKNISDSQRNNYPNINSKQSYIEQLELKIQEQARRLNELYKYKLLCEKRIRELNPNEVIPLTEESIRSNSKKSSVKDESENNKYDELYEKYKTLKKNFKDFKEQNSAQSERSNDSNINIEKYKLLKEKYKQLKNENEKIVDLLNQEVNATEEQKNIISILQQTIDSELFKSGAINQYITPENIIDFIKLKSEADEYRKQLVLSQAMVNSLKYEIEQLNKEKKDNNEIRKNSIEKSNIENNLNLNDNKLNSEIDDYYYKKSFKGRSNSQNKLNIDNIRKNINSLDFSENDNYNNDNYSDRNNNKNYLNENLELKTNINKQNQTISGLLKEKSELKKLISELMYKLNESISLNNNARDKIKNLELEIGLKKNELSQFEDKFTYFNDYISNLKKSLSDLQNFLKNYISIFNKMANEDLNSLLTKSFSDNILVLKNKISNIPSIQKYNLEYDADSKLIKAIIDTLTIVNSEFVNIYEKVFESNGYCKESTQKLEQLQNEINTRNLNLENQKNDINYINNQLNEQIQQNIKMKSNNDNLIEDNSSLIFENSQLKRDIDFLNHFNNKNIDLMNIICKISQITDGKLSKIIKEAININQIISKLKEERNDAYQQLNKKNNLNQSINIEKNTLNQLLNEFDRKINEKEVKLDELKRELNILFNMYNSYGNNEINNINYNPLNINPMNNKHQITNSFDYSIKKTYADSNLYTNTEFNNTHQNTMSNQSPNYDNNLNYKYGNNEDFQKFIETNNTNPSLTNSYSKNPEFFNNDRKKITYQVINTSPH